VSEADKSNEAAAPALVSQEFFVRVNDFLEQANRIERRFDTHHAELAMLHGLSRYSAHHYRSTTSHDDAANRAAFAEYIGNTVRQLVAGHLDDMLGQPAAPAADADGDATPAATPAASPGPDAGE
jgi:hypothetical protein